MNWIKENKFLFGFLVVMALGVGAGGWYLLGAKGRYDEAVSDYERRVGELNRLQRLPTFPNQKNLDKIVAQQNEVNAEVSALASSLMAQQIPLEELSPEKFQDELKKSVTAVKTKASQSSPAIKLPEPKFFLGFEQYETAPPAKEAAAELGRELKAIEWLCNQAIENKVAEIKRLDREALPEEKGRVKVQVKKPAAPAKGAPGKPDATAKAGSRYEVEKHRIELTFVADQARFRQFLNAIVSHKGQFFIPRLVSVKNENTKAPPRIAAAAAVEVPAAPDPNAPAAATPPTVAAPTAPAVASTYIVGEEKVEVTLVLEMVDFHEAASK